MRLKKKKKLCIKENILKVQTFGQQCYCDPDIF